MKKLLITSLILFPNVIMAQASGAIPDVGQMFANFGSSSIEFMHFFRGLAFLMGLFITILGIWRLKGWAEAQGKEPLTKPLITIIVGIFLINFPQTIDMVSETMLLSSNYQLDLLAEVNPSGPGAIFGAALTGVFLFFKMLGHIAVIHGFIVLKKIGEGGQQASLFSALTRIIFGTALINFGAFITVLGATFAPGIDLSGLFG